MGRSVLPHSSATAIAYSTFEPDEEFYQERYDEEFEGSEDAPDFESWMWEQWNYTSGFEWESYKDFIAEDVCALFPSMVQVDGDEWEGDENKILARNSHSEVSISEYCGVVAISLAARSDVDLYYSEEISLYNLGEQWRKKVEEKFLSRLGGMDKIDTFSDGTSVYRKRA